MPFSRNSFTLAKAESRVNAFRLAAAPAELGSAEQKKKELRGHGTNKRRTRQKAGCLDFRDASTWPPGMGSSPPPLTPPTLVCIGCVLMIPFPIQWSLLEPRQAFVQSPPASLREKNSLTFFTFPSTLSD